MATESAVTTMGAHPFSTGADQCLVHNGSLSNHNSLRRKLIRNGVHFETDNDTEVAAAYLTHSMQKGASLGADCVKKEMRAEHIALLQDLLDRAGADATPKEFTRYGSARQLYHFDIDNTGAY